ncbi:hypothetical protein D9B85_15365, partial [Corynebacterium diphtheriae]
FPPHLRASSRLTNLFELMHLIGRRGGSDKRFTAVGMSAVNQEALCFPPHLRASSRLTNLFELMHLIGRRGGSDKRFT